MTAGPQLAIERTAAARTISPQGKSASHVNGNYHARSASGGLRGTFGRLLGPMGVFFRGFLENPGMVASVIPSSRVTIDAMLERVDWKSCKLFVEYGPGVGTFCPISSIACRPAGNCW